MLVLNIKSNPHKVLKDNKENTILSSSKKKKSVKTNKNEELIFGVSHNERTVLTDEQKKYLKLYEEKHDKLFGTKDNDKNFVKIYVVKDEKDVVKNKSRIIKNTSIVKEEAKEVKSEAETRVVDIENNNIIKNIEEITVPEVKISSEIVKVPTDHIEPATEIITESTTEYIEPSAKTAEIIQNEKVDNWFKRTIKAIKNFFRRVFKKDEIK